MALVWPAPRVHGAEITWSFPLEGNHVAFVELRLVDETLLARFRAADNRQWSRFGWRPDEDEREGYVGGSLPRVFLPQGLYYVDIALPTGSVRRQWMISEPAPLGQAVRLPAGATGTLAWGFDADNAMDGLAWTPTLPGVDPLIGLDEGRWAVFATGVGSLPARIGGGGAQGERETGAQGGADGGPLRIVDLQVPEGGFKAENETWLLRLLLLPVTLVIIALGAFGLSRAVKWRGAWLAILGSVGLAIALCHRILSDIAGQVPCRFPNNYRDPFDSIFFVASFEDSLLRLSDVTFNFSLPVGASWLGTGPAWLGYILPGLLSNLTGPVVANNVAVVLALAALGFSVWCLTRALGGGGYTAVLAGGAVMLAPVIMAEIDKASFDRLVLFPIPLFFLCLHKAAEEEGWRWVVAAGVALATVFYGQIYYGLYLAAACPFLVLYRLIGRDWRGRLKRMLGVGVVAIALLAPGLYTLRMVTSGSNYDAEPLGLIRSTAPLWPPVEKAEMQDFFGKYDIRTVVDPNLRDISRQPDLPMATPLDRFLAAASTGLFWEDFKEPVNHLPGDARFWALIAGAVLLAAGQRWAALVIALDIVVLMAFSLGPVLRTREEPLMIPMPYYLNLLFIPGFDQLKNIYRYRLMAATLCGVPLALGLEGLFHYLKKVGIPRFGLVEAGLAAFISFKLISGSFLWPKAFAYPETVVLERLKPAPTLILPLEATLVDPASILQPIQLGFPLVNEFPLEPLRRTSGSGIWFDHNGLLNHLAYLAGSQRPKFYVPLVDLNRDLTWFHDAGVEYIMLYRRLMAGPELVGETTAFLDGLFERVAQDGHVTVWRVPKGATGALSLGPGGAGGVGGDVGGDGAGAAPGVEGGARAAKAGEGEI